MVWRQHMCHTGVESCLSVQSCLWDLQQRQRRMQLWIYPWKCRRPHFYCSRTLFQYKLLWSVMNALTFSEARNCWGWLDAQCSINACYPLTGMLTHRFISFSLLSEMLIFYCLRCRWVPVLTTHASCCLCVNMHNVRKVKDKEMQTYVDDICCICLCLTSQWLPFCAWVCSSTFLMPVLTIVLTIQRSTFVIQDCLG